MKRSYIAKRFQRSGAGLSLDTEALAKYKDIIEMIYALDKLAPGTANYDTLLYGAVLNSKADAQYAA